MKINNILLMILLIAVNLIHLPFTWLLVAVEYQNGQIFGSGVSIFAIILWIIEFISIPLVIYALISGISNIVKRTSVKLAVTDLILFVMYLGQVALFNIIVFFNPFQ